MSDIKLDTRFVGSITGKFFLPSYQRGYRWGAKEVRMLLNDILQNGDKPYSLQPVVVRNLGDRYELVDGQQRLTTLFILLSYIKDNYKPRISVGFSLIYETRTESETFLKDISSNIERENENIDFWFMSNAYRTMKDWFEKKGKEKLNFDDVVASDIFNYLNKNVKVIWYEIPKEESAVDLFTRLNIGKIPLTSSELVKALFLRNDAGDVLKHQEEISLQWDNIERDLHDESLWAFLTNEKTDKYPTRIDLVLDLMSDKQPGERDDYYTFFHFAKLAESKSLYEVWQEIQRTFLILKEWRYNHELYHKIGYLISSGHKSLSDIYHDTKDLRKSEIRSYLDDAIRESINFKTPYEELSYDNRDDYNCISRLLLLFNVESVRTVDHGNQWFPFAKHKRANWSLEHIHAQHSEGLDSNEKRAEWLRVHFDSLSALQGDDVAQLKADITQLLDDIASRPKTTKIGEQFEKIQRSVTEKLTSSGSEYIHTIGNMALLDSSDNAALSNYVFDAKRNLVVEWDRKGRYIPFCTKMAFFKYYTPSDKNQLHFWGEPDRRAYIEAINTKLANYLNAPISIDNN